MISQFLVNNSMFIILGIFIFAFLYDTWYNYFAKVNKFDDRELITRWIKVQQIKKGIKK